MTLVVQKRRDWLVERTVFTLEGFDGLKIVGEKEEVRERFPVSKHGDNVIPAANFELHLREKLIEFF